MWDIWNSIIKNSYSQYFIDNIIKDSVTDVVDSFNSYFVRFGPNLEEHSWAAACGDDEDGDRQESSGSVPHSREGREITDRQWG